MLKRKARPVTVDRCMVQGSPKRQHTAVPILHPVTPSDNIVASYTLEVTGQSLSVTASIKHCASGTILIGPPVYSNPVTLRRSCSRILGPNSAVVASDVVKVVAPNKHLPNPLSKPMCLAIPSELPPPSTRSIPTPLPPPASPSPLQRLAKQFSTASAGALSRFGLTFLHEQLSSHADLDLVLAIAYHRTRVLLCERIEFEASMDKKWVELFGAHRGNQLCSLRIQSSPVVLKHAHRESSHQLLLLCHTATNTPAPPIGTRALVLQTIERKQSSGGHSVPRNSNLSPQPIIPPCTTLNRRFTFTSMVEAVREIQQWTRMIPVLSELTATYIDIPGDMDVVVNGGIWWHYSHHPQWNDVICRLENVFSLGKETLARDTSSYAVKRSGFLRIGDEVCVRDATTNAFRYLGHVSRIALKFVHIHEQPRLKFRARCLYVLHDRYP